MSAEHAAETAKIHARLNHPVIDSDGHWIEFEPAAVEYLRQVGGEKIVERYSKVANQFGNKKRAQTLPEERRERRMLQPGWWGSADQEYSRPRHCYAAQAALRTHGRAGA